MTKWAWTNREAHWIAAASLTVLYLNLAAAGCKQTTQSSSVASQARLVLQTGATVNSVAFSPDGKILASGGADDTVKLWDVSTGRELRTLRGHSDAVASVAFSPDGKTLASASSDNTVKLWDVSTGAELRTLNGDSGVFSVAFSSDGKILASGSLDNTVKLWDVSTGAELRTLKGHYSYVTSVAFGPDGKILASGSQDETVKLWDVSTGKELRTLKGHSQIVESVAFSPDGKTLASASGDNTVKLWEVSTGAELRTLKGHSSEGILSGVTSIAFSPDRKTLASGSWDKTIKLWDVSTGTELRTLKGDSVVFSVAFSPNGKTLASGSKDKTIKLWDVYAAGAKQIDVAKAIREDEKTVTVPIADLTLTVPTELTEKSPSIEPKKNGDITWTDYSYGWSNRSLTLEVDVLITAWDKGFPPEAGGGSPDVMLERYYAVGERQKNRGEIEELRYLELDGVKGVFSRVAVDWEGKNRVWILWETFRYHKDKAQNLRVYVKGVRSDLEKLMKVINSASLAQK